MLMNKLFMGSTLVFSKCLCRNQIEVSSLLSKVCELRFHSSVVNNENKELVPKDPVEEVNVSQAEMPDKLYKKIELEIRGNDPAVLKSYGWYTATAAQHLGIEIGKSWTPRKAHHERYSLLRSIHVKKKYQVQYEFRTYFHFMQFHCLTGSTADTFLEYIQRNLPEGVAMKVTKVAIEPMPDHIKIPEKEHLEVEASN